MKRKTLFAICLFIAIALISSFSFATTEAMNNMKNSLENVGQTAGEMIKDTKNSIVNGTTTLTQKTSNVINKMTDDDGNKSIQNSSIMQTQNSNYSTMQTATAANNTLFGLTSNTWLWIIMGIVGAIIVGLVWYYGSQYENESYNQNK